MKNFRGWSTVFAFTYKQNSGTKAYRLVTVLGAILVLAVAVVLVVLSAKPEKEDEQESCPVKKAYVLELSSTGTAPAGTASAGAVPAGTSSAGTVSSGLVSVGTSDAVDYAAVVAAVIAQKENTAYYEEFEVETVSGITEEELQIMAAQEESGAAIGVIIEEAAGQVSVRSIVPSTSDLSVYDGQEIAELVSEAVRAERIRRCGLTARQVAELEKTVMFSIVEAGGGRNIISYLIQLITPMVFGLILYFMLLLYGQTISKEVSTEKTSKLMETLLTSLHPYALLAGKVFAIVATAFVQFFLWIAAGVAGVFGGVQLALLLYPESKASVDTMVSFLRDNIGESALSPTAVVLSLIVFVCGFLFYSVLSGMAGSMVNRPEDAANVQSIFTLPILISWFVCYMSVLMENEGVLVIARHVPFTIPFCVPAELLTGSIGITQGIVSALILLVFSVLAIMVSARLYRGLVLYNGQKLSLKTMVGIVRNK